MCVFRSVLLFGGVMQVCLGALLCRRHRYTAYCQLVRLCWVIWERTFVFHCLPVLSSGYEKSIHRKTMEDFTKCKSDWVTGHHPWLWSGSYAPWQPVPYLASPFLTREWVTLQWFRPVCSGLGAQLNYLLHQVINVLWRNTNSHFSLNMSNIM